MRKCIWPGVAALSMLMFSALASADSLSEQRQRYQDVKSAGMPIIWRKWNA